MSITLEDIQEALQQNSVPAGTISKIINELKEIQKETKVDDGLPKKKNQLFVVARSNGDKSIRDKIQTAFVIQTKDDYNPSNFLTDMENAKMAHNRVQKKQKNVLGSLVEVFSKCKAKFCKENNFSVKTKQFVQVLWLD